jgi:transcription elongation GreA/GreB family factor
VASTGKTPHEKIMEIVRDARRQGFEAGKAQAKAKVERLREVLAQVATIAEEDKNGSLLEIRELADHALEEVE